MYRFLLATFAAVVGLTNYGTDAVACDTLVTGKQCRGANKEEKTCMWDKKNETCVDYVAVVCANFGKRKKCIKRKKACMWDKPKKKCVDKVDCSSLVEQTDCQAEKKMCKWNKKKDKCMSKKKKPKKL